MKSTHEMLKLLYASLTLKDANTGRGICYFVSLLWGSAQITDAEHDVLKYYIMNNRPKVKGLHSEFTTSEHATPFSDWWWLLTDEGYQQRKEFLTKLINLTK